MSVRTSLFRVALRRGRSWDCPRISIRGGCTGAQPARWGREPAGSRGQVMPNMKRPARSKRQPGDTQEMAAERGVSQPKVSHQVETNVVTQAERPPVPLRESDPAAPPRAAADDRRNSVLGRVCRASVHSTAGRIVGGSVLVIATHGSVPGMGKAVGRPLILQGSYPAGAPGGAWPKVSTLVCQRFTKQLPTLEARVGSRSASFRFMRTEFL